MKKITFLILIFLIMYIGTISEANKTNMLHACRNTELNYSETKEISMQNMTPLLRVLPKSIFYTIVSETYHEVPKNPSHEFDNISREPKNRVQDARSEIVGNV